MNHDRLKEVSSVWTLATGRPLPFLPEPEDVPDDFSCPDCGTPKDGFEKI